MHDELRPIPGFEGAYSVTIDGRIWSHTRNRRRGQWMTPAVNSRGYLSTVFHLGAKPYPMLVHQAVALAWVPNLAPDVRREINHIDGIKTHCHASNLEWCTRSENVLHAYRTGLNPPRASKRRTLSSEQAALIRSMVASGDKPVSVAKHFGVSRQLIHSIVHHRSYRLQT